MDVVLCPFELAVDGIPRFLNAELVGHPVYDGLELQWFEGSDRGTGLLAFLSRREDRRVDYYVQPGLELDRDGYRIGGGTGAWTETDFTAARLEVGEEGVEADVRFRDVDGRVIEVRVDDRGAGRRSAADVLAPVGSGIDRPASLMLVYMHGFDLLRHGATAPLVRIDGEDVPIGRLPAARLHRRHLVKAAAPLHVAQVCPARDGAVRTIDPERPGDVELDGSGAIRSVGAAQGDASARLRFEPAFPRLDRLAEDVEVPGRWEVSVDGDVITGGPWHAVRRSREVQLRMDVTDRWKPRRGSPALIWMVTGLVPVFRRWPTTYMWHAQVTLGDAPAMTSRWERTGADRGERYRQVTRS